MGLHLSRETVSFAGDFVFLISYLVFAFGRIPGTRIDRTAMALIGATLMLGLGVLTPQQALASVNFPTLILLFGMMVVAAGLAQTGFFAWLTGRVIARMPPRALLPAVIFTSGILSSILVNDVVCVVMTPLVLATAHYLRRPALPYLLALATAANIGGVATITGTPQNMLISSVAGIHYLAFLGHLGPVALLGLLVDWALLSWLFRKELHQTVASASDAMTRAAKAADQHIQKINGSMLKPLVIALLVVVALMFGITPAFAAIGAACLLLFSRRRDPATLLAAVDWSLLLFFAGLFVVLGGGEAAGVSARLLTYAERLNLQNTVLFTTAVTLLGNVVSNVPAVMLLQPLAAKLSHTASNPHSLWLLLAMASTLAGNLTITGSVANIIVVESARKEMPISFWQYLRVGVPITLVTLAIGWMWLSWL
ncbi:MAG: ArsB/NhaD family transporter [Acidobacteriaceae bacterium]